jgi:hypothetical protein
MTEGENPLATFFLCGAASFSAIKDEPGQSFCLSVALMNLLLFSRGRWSCNDQVPSTFLQLTPSLRIRTVYTAAHIQKWTAVLISL